MQKVLMIDDAPMMHRIVKARLGGEEIEFHSATGGDEGLAMAARLEPDVILLDIEMPAPDGIEVCRRLKEDPRLSYVPVIFLTAATSTEEKVKGLSMGAMDYVTKPFDAAELQARVRACLRTKFLMDLLSTKAMIDGLTGLRNRTYFDERLAAQEAQFKRHGRPFACVLADVDHFKSVNDAHGHLTGDRVLRGVAQIIQEGSPPDDVVCRFGGEELAILTPGVAADGALALAERLCAAVAARPFNRDGQLRVTCSFGVAQSLPDSPLPIVERADRALYAAKRSGRNRVCADAPAEGTQPRPQQSAA